MAARQSTRTHKAPRTPTFKVNPSLAAKLKVVGDDVNLTAEDMRKVERMIDDTRDYGRKGAIFDVLLRSRHDEISRSQIAGKLGIEPKAHGLPPRLYPHDIDQLDQLVADKLVHQRFRTLGSGKGNEVVYQVSSPVCQIQDERERAILQRQRREAERVETERLQEERDRLEAERKAIAERKAAARAAHELQRAALHPEPRLEAAPAPHQVATAQAAILTPAPRRSPPAARRASAPRPRFTPNQLVILGALAFGVLALLVVIILLIVQ